MLRSLMQGTSWIALHAPDDEKGADSDLGDAHGDDVLEGGPETPPEPETPPVAETPPVETPAPPVIDKPKPDWKDKEMARRARRIDEERSKAEKAEQRAKAAEELAESLARQREAGEPPPEAPPRQGKVYTEEDVKTEAARIARENEFKRDFDNAYQGGSSQFGKAKMDEAIARISELGGLDYDHLQMVLATDEPAKVLYDLGSKPEEFQRIMELPFQKRVAEFVKMGLKTEPKSHVPSRAPAPVEPIGGGGGSVDNRYDDRASDSDWFKEEEKRAAAAWKKRQDSWR